MSPDDLDELPGLSPDGRITTREALVTATSRPAREAPLPMALAMLKIAETVNTSEDKDYYIREARRYLEEL